MKTIRKIIVQYSLNWSNQLLLLLLFIYCFKYKQMYYFILIQQMELSVGRIKAAVEGAHIQLSYQKENTGNYKLYLA